MSTQEAFWSRVQAALDARENPFEDALVEEALVENPEWLAGLLALTERIQFLPAQVHPARVPVAGPLGAAPRRVAAAAGLLLALGLCVRPPARTPEEVPSAATLDAPVGRILDWSITVRHIRQDSRSCVHNVNGHLSTEGASLEQTPPLPGATVVASMRLARSVPPPPHSR
ncbi:MAG: hypothetical protein O2816_11895 [Planctomycetota bacterium]|nr:hypothetical protein [Planctomycetota bacterium]